MFEAEFGQRTADAILERHLATDADPETAALAREIVGNVVLHRDTLDATITAASKVDPSVRGAAIVTVTASSGGGGTVTITTIYRTTLAVTSDPAGHEQFTRFTTINSITGELTGSNIRLTGASPWVTLTGTVGSNNAVTATGSGTVAGNPNVTVTYTGTVNTNSMSGSVTLGPGLPQNQNETLSVTGSKQ